MKLNNEYLIPFTGLKIGKHEFAYAVRGDFFKSFEYDEINEADIAVTVVLDKKSTMLELGFQFTGHVNVDCDVTTESFDLPITGEDKLIVKFGDEYLDEDIGLISIPQTSHEVDVSQFLYEILLFAIPSKRVHPGVEDGTLESDILTKLEELAPKDEKKETDPVWDKLKGLIEDN